MRSIPDVAVYQPENESPSTATLPVRRAAYGDVIRIVGSVAVITSHVVSESLFSNDLVGGFEPVRGNLWVGLMAIDAVSFFAVPCFVMLSGALLLKPRRYASAGEFYSRRLSRIGVPLLFWSAFFFALTVRSYGPEVAMKNLVAGVPAAHLHFVFRLAGLYAITPMLLVFITHASRPMVFATTFLCLFLASSRSLVGPWLDVHSTAFDLFVPYLGFYLLGHLLASTILSTRQTILAGVGFVAGAAGIVIGTLLMKQMLGNLYISDLKAMWFIDHLNPFRILLAVCAFMFIRTAFANPWPDAPSWRFVSHHLAPATLGVYLIHPIVQHFLKVGGVDINLTSPIVSVPLTIASVVVLSWLLAMIAGRTPVVRWTVGSGS